MRHFLWVGLLVAGGAWPAAAEEAPAPSYEASSAMRFVDLDFKGSRGRAQEYDGKLYRYMHGDLGFSGQSAAGLVDLQVQDIGSTEENGFLNADYKDLLQFSARFDTLHHRRDFARTGIILNGVWTPTPYTAQEVAVGQELMFRRTESEVNLTVFNPANAAQFFSAQYWGVDKVGRMDARAPAAGSIATSGAANVDNSKRDLDVGVGTNLKQDGSLTVDVVRSEFRDNAFIVNDPNVTSRQIKPRLPAQQMTGAEGKFRYDVSQRLSLTGALTGRQRENLSNQYKFNSVVGALNAAYRASHKLSLTAKLYARAFVIDENSGYMSPLAGRKGNTSQMDKTTLRGDLAASYRPLEKLLLSAGYKAELNNRRDAPTLHRGSGFTSDGTLWPDNLNTEAAHSDVKHIFKAGAKYELPFGIEAEAGYKRLQANYSSFGNQPNRQNDANLTITVPLPQRVDLTLMSGYLDETGNQSPWDHALTRNDYRASLDWAATNKSSIGADVAYENIRYFTNGFIGDRAATAGAATAAANWFEPGLPNRQKNTTAGGHGRINLPKGLVVMGDGSYTWSTEETPLHWRSSQGAVGDYTPRDVRIARGGVVLAYTPAKYKHLTARASYRIDDWVDKFDSNNSGRASVSQVGLEAKF